MKRIKYCRSKAYASAFCYAALLAGTYAAQPILVNGDFEMADLTGWTLFTTAQGTVGTPSVVMFDTAHTGTPSWSTRFQAGSINPDGITQEGGGIFQGFLLPFSGNVNLSLNIASYSQYPNGSGGLVKLSFDGQIVGQWDFGDMSTSGGTTKYHTFSTVIPGVIEGNHEVRILATRA